MRGPRRIHLRGGWESLAMGLGFRLHFFVFFAFGLPKFWGRIASVWKTVGELNFGWIPPEPNFPKSVFAKPIFPKSAYPKPILHPNQLFPLQNRFFPNRPIQNRIFPNRFLQNQFFLSRLIQNRFFTQINFFHNRFFPDRLSQINFSLNTWFFQKQDKLIASPPKGRLSDQITLLGLGLASLFTHTFHTHFQHPRVPNDLTPQDWPISPCFTICSHNTMLVGLLFYTPEC